MGAATTGKCLKCGKTSFRDRQEKVEKDFKKLGCVLLDKYVHKRKSMHYICWCGSLAHMTYENMSKNKIGCRKCVSEARFNTSLKLKNYTLPSSRVKCLPTYGGLYFSRYLSRYSSGL